MIIFTFHQSYYINKLLTIHHDYPVPVDKHGSAKPLIPPKRAKTKYSNFAITKAVVNMFAEILHADRAANAMKHIKRNFSLKAWVRPPGVDFRVGAEAKIKLFFRI